MRFDARIAFVSCLLAAPTLAVPVKLMPHDIREGDEFGVSCAIKGELVVVGAWGSDTNGEDAGAVYVYRRAGSEWIEEQKLVAGDGAPGDYFGAAVVFAGGDIAVGAVGGDDVAEDSGSVYVFRHDGERWVEIQKLLPSNASPMDSFGHSLQGNDEVLAVGATYANELGLRNAGSVFLFRKTDAGWIEQQSIGALYPSQGANFGAAMALSSDSLVVGAPAHDGAGRDSGNANVFASDGETWQDSGVLARSIGVAGDRFGNIVAFLGDELLVGVPRADDYSTNGGVVAAFINSGSSWVESAGPQIAPASDAEFGWSLDVSGARVAVGAPSDSRFGPYHGAAYVFRRGDGWVLEQELHAPDGAVYDRFGTPVRMWGSYVVVGASEHDERGPNAGAAYVFLVPDCNENFVFDDLDVDEGSSPDCNGNQLPDECEVPPRCQSCWDCNETGVPDECEVPPLCLTCADCNEDGLPDACEDVTCTTEPLFTVPGKPKTMCGLGMIPSLALTLVVLLGLGQGTPLRVIPAVPPIAKDRAAARAKAARNERRAEMIGGTTPNYRLLRAPRAHAVPYESSGAFAGPEAARAHPLRWVRGYCHPGAAGRRGPAHRLPWDS